MSGNTSKRKQYKHVHRSMAPVGPTGSATQDTTRSHSKRPKTACEQASRTSSGEPWKDEPMLATLRASRANLHDGMAHHPYLLELRKRMALEQPGSRVRDVPAKGDCFFLSANIGLQALQRAPRTNGNDELEDAGWRDRAAVTGLMRARLTSHPLIDGDELQIKLALAALDTGDGPPFPGADGTAQSYLRYMSKAYSWAEELAIAAWQEHFSVRIRLRSNQGTHPAPIPPMWSRLQGGQAK